MIGSVQLTLSEMQTMAVTGYKAKLVGGDKKKGGRLCVMECEVEESPGDDERRGSVAAYPPSRRSSACSFNQNDPKHEEILFQQAQAQELLSQSQEQCPKYDQHHQALYPAVVPDNECNQPPQWTETEFQDSSCPYPAQLALPECPDKRPQYMG